MKTKRELGTTAATRWYVDIAKVLADFSPEERAEWWVGFLNEIIQSCQASMRDTRSPDRVLLRMAWGALNRAGETVAADELGKVLASQKSTG